MTTFKNRKATDEQLLESYARTKSVKKTGSEFGMCGQSVHERLVKLRANNRVNVFSPEADQILIDYYNAYADTGRLDDLARMMHRTKPFIARQARRLGLTVANRKKPYLAEGASLKQKEWLKTNPHPRGMLGKKQSDKFKEDLSQRSFDRWHSMTKEKQISFTSTSHRSWKAAWRTIGGKKKYYRSTWEANYARYLNWLQTRGEILEWDHEPITFWFLGIKRGTRSYLPDFRVVEKGGSVAFHEVKGWMDPKSKTKIKRMAIYHPTVKLILIEGKAYKSIEKTMRPMICDWE